MNGDNKNKTPLKTGGILGLLAVVVIGIVTFTIILKNSSNSDSGNIITDATEIQDDAKDAVMKTELDNIESALISYYSENMEYPADLQDLVEGGYMMDIKIEGTEVKYERIGDRDYELSITLTNGEEYSR